MLRHVVLYFASFQENHHLCRRWLYNGSFLLTCLLFSRLVHHDDRRKFVAIKVFATTTSYTFYIQSIGFYGFIVKSRIWLSKLRLNKIYLPQNGPAFTGRYYDVMSFCIVILYWIVFSAGQSDVQIT